MHSLFIKCKRVLMFKRTEEIDVHNFWYIMNKIENIIQLDLYAIKDFVLK